MSVSPRCLHPPLELADRPAPRRHHLGVRPGRAGPAQPLTTHRPSGIGSRLVNGRQRYVVGTEYCWRAVADSLVRPRPGVRHLWLKLTSAPVTPSEFPSRSDVSGTNTQPFDRSSHLRIGFPPP